MHNFRFFLDDWLTVLHNITFYHQIDAQTSSFFTYNTLIKIPYMFRAYPAHLQVVHFVNVYMQPLVSSLSAGDCLVHRLRKKFFLNRCTRQSPAESDDTRGCIYTYNTFIKILYMFRAFPCSSSGGLRRNCIYAASGIVTLCR